jgi:phosphomevalonate kinase
VSSLVTWLRYGDIERVQQQVRRAREVLGGLDSLLSLGWMTPRLRALCTTAEAFGVAAKPSGAGGGDCGIALIRPDQQARVPALRDQWIRGGIVPLGLRPHYANEEEMT